MEFRYSNIGSFVIRSPVGIVGGYDRTECLKTVEKYYPEDNSWKQLTSMLVARGRCGVCVLRNCVYAVGGSNGSTDLSMVECYNPESDKWIQVAPLPTAKSNVGKRNIFPKVLAIFCTVIRYYENCYMEIHIFGAGNVF